MKKSLYCCSSYYQLLITLAKILNDQEAADLFLEVHGLETAEELALRMKAQQFPYVDQIYVCDTLPDADPYEQWKEPLHADQEHILTDYVEGLFGTELTADSYENFNVFWDLGYGGTYLNLKQIPYVLHEDSLNSYQNIRKNRAHYAYIFTEKRDSHGGVLPFGYSPWCKQVEVNSPEHLDVDHPNLRAVPRGPLMEQLSDADKKRIFHLFFPDAGGKQENSDTDKKKVLLLTEPFALTGRLPDEEAQRRLYADLMDVYGKDSTVLIKAHPRDTMAYRVIFPQAVVLEKNVPTEVLNFDSGFQVDVALTVSSSAVQGILRAKERITLGAEYLERYR